jgi:transposase-like protein
MEYSKQPLQSWFYAMHLMTSIKQVLSAKEVQHQLGMEQYPPVWLMMMKLRDIMGKRESIYQLSGEVELDEAFFPTKLDDTAKMEPLKRGAGSQRQTKVLVIAESKPIDNLLMEYLSAPNVNTSSKISSLLKSAKNQSVKKVIHYIKMIVIDDQKASTIDKIVGKSINAMTTIVTDGSASHVNFERNFARHEAHIEDNVEEVVRNVLPWVHIIIGECRDGIAAIHKEVDKRFLQLYLNEYCWKFNRRFFRDSSDPRYDLFDRLVRISAIYKSNILWRDYAKMIEKEEM